MVFYEKNKTPAMTSKMHQIRFSLVSSLVPVVALDLGESIGFD